MPSEWVELNGEFDALDSGWRGVLLLPDDDFNRERHRVGSLAAVTAAGLDEKHAVLLALRPGPDEVPLLHEDDFEQMRAGGSASRPPKLLLRSLRIRERLSLVDLGTRVLVLLTIISGLLALGAALLPVDRAAEDARRTAQRVAEVGPALSTEETKSIALHTLQHSATSVQRALTAPARAHLPSATADERLGEILEHGVSRAESAWGREEQAARDLRTWRDELQREARPSSHSSRSQLDALAKLFAALTAVAGAVVLGRQSRPGAARR